MPSLSTRASGVSGIGDLLVLRDEQADSRVELSPSRGALISSFTVAGRELLYLDGATFRDLSKNVRGGIPVLFPSPGRLEGDAYQHDGRRFFMKQHGFARTLPFKPSARRGDEACVTLTLSASEATLAQFPWPFRLDLTVSLRGTELSLRTRVSNPGETPLPFALGFHPYFAVSDKAVARIDTQATRAFDNVQKREVPFPGFQLAGPEVDLHLLDHGSTHSALHLGDGTQIVLRGSADFTRWVVWTLPQQPFVCVEPWTAPFDALRTGEGLLHVAPGATHESFVSLSLSQR